MQRTHASTKRPLLSLALLILALPVALLVSTASWVGTNPLAEVLLLGVLAVVCLLPAIVGQVRGTLDVFEPIHAFSLSALIYFVLVPAILIANDAFRMLGVDYRPALPKALALATLALGAFYLGYYWAQTPVPRVALLTRSPEDRALLRSARGLATGLVVFFGALVVLWIVVARIPLKALWIFGGASYGDAFTLAEGTQVGYLYGAREALPACLLLFTATRARKRWTLLTILPFLVVGLLFAGTGGRTRVLLLAMSAPVYYFLERSERPKLRSILIVAFLIFYVVVGGIGFYRGTDLGDPRAVGTAQYGVSDAWDTFVEGSQISVSTSLVVRYVPEVVDYFGGASFINLITQPIPRFLWPDKPGTVIVGDAFAGLWPRGTAMPFWVVFYLNFGPFGVLAGMLLLGFSSRWLYGLYRRAPNDLVAQVAVALYFPWMVHIYGRGGLNPGYLIYSVVYVFVPVLIMWWYLRRRTKKAPQALVESGAQAMGRG